MTDSFQDRLNRVEATLQGDPVAAALAAFDKRMGSGSHLPAPAAPKPAETSERTFTRAEAMLMKLNEFSPFERDPHPVEVAFLSPAERQAASEIRDLVAGSSTMEERLEAKQRWDRLVSERQEYRAEQVERHFARQVEEARQQAATRAELAESAKRERAAELHSLGERARNLIGGGLFAEAATTGALEMADGPLSEAGWGRAAISKLAEVRSRMVEVDPHGPIEGAGFQMAEAEGRVYAYVPQGHDVAAFVDSYGVDRAPEPEAASDPSTWRYDGSL